MWLTLLIFALYLSCHRHVKSLKRATGTEYIATSDLYGGNALQTFCHGGQVSWVFHDKSDITFCCLQLRVILNTELNGEPTVFEVS